MKTYEERIKDWQDIVKELERTECPGVLPSPPDPRDYDIDDIPVYSSRYLPVRHILPTSPIILDQGQTGYCAGASGAGVANAYFHNHGLMPEQGFSMAFLYWLCKEYDGIPHINGTYIRTLLKIMSKYGCASEAIAPYSTSKIPITVKAIKEAEDYKIEAYARLNTPSDIKKALDKGMYIIIGTLVTRDNWRRTYLSYPSGDLYGGHATHLFGYNDLLEKEHIGYYKGQNSWGKRFHDNGRFFLPYDYHNMIYQGRNTFLEAWAVKFPEIGKKKEELPKPIIPPIVPDWESRQQTFLDAMARLRQRMEELREEMRKLLQRR